MWADRIGDYLQIILQIVLGDWHWNKNKKQKEIKGQILSVVKKWYGCQRVLVRIAVGAFGR